MSILALRRGRGPAFPDLPPTLLPHAVLVSAPPSDTFRAAAISGLIYLFLAAGALAFSALAPRTALVPVRPSVPDRIVEFDPPPMHRLIERLSPGPTGSSGSGQPTASTAAVVPRSDPDQAPAGLPTEDHHGDPPAAGPVASGPLVPGASPPSGVGGGSAIHDFSMTGLAVTRRVDPLYPDFARSARVQGVVLLLMTVDEQGVPFQVQVLEGHPALREAAQVAARQWRFEPARLDGRPVAASFRLTLKFTLR